MLQQTLTITLKKLTILQSSTTFNRATISLISPTSSTSLPNPRFIKNKSASFYSQQLNLPIQFQDQNIYLYVYGFVQDSKKLLGEILVSFNSLFQTKERTIEKIYADDCFELSYEVSLKMKSSVEVDSQNSFIEENAEKQDGNKNVIVEILEDQIEQIKKQIKPPPKTLFLTINRIPTDRSVSEQKQTTIKSNKMKIYSPRRKRISSNESSEITNVSQYRFMEPITHSSSKTQQSSQEYNMSQKRVLNNQELGKSRCKICKVGICYRTLTVYILISFFSFVLGTVVKQEFGKQY